ncbi:MAG: ribose-phosphate diphosphokinase, partial [Deltaproteobacteria bacterium]|nr:ribose-phosphate diphosphokinase [Deltaproteobacteria bacterium]
MKPLLFYLASSQSLGESLAQHLEAELGLWEHRLFPDGETYLRVKSNCEARTVFILASLDHPNEKTLPLIFLSETLKELGASWVGLISPYLAYMRQDKRFHPGEALSSKTFAQLISRYFDGLVTVDPHLHRYHSLDEIYTIPNQVLSATPLLSDWIESKVEKPLLLGPDSESEQWVAQVAKDAKAPYVILEKTRHGDREVEVTFPSLAAYQDYQPILIDDMISTGHTLIEAIKHLKQAHLKAPICLSIHGLFAE